MTGESIELAIKALLVLTGREPPTTHKIGDCLGKVPELRKLMERLWKKDFEFLIQMVDEDINASQMRYGAAGSYIDKKTGLIAAATAHKATTWTAAVTEIYEELMGSIGSAIWENYPQEDSRGMKMEKRITMRPILFASDRSRKDCYPSFPKGCFGFILTAERLEIETEYCATIPIERLPKKGQRDYWVRVRIDKETAVDQQVMQMESNLELTKLKWIGRPVEGVRLKLYIAKSNLALRPVLV